MASSSQNSRLFQPIQIGRHTLSNRIALAPLTRFRVDDNHVPNVELVKEYYAQRASYKGTLLISEATFISPRASGFKNAPGIWNDEQVAAWKQVVDAVHGAGGIIYLQLWALGRVARRSVKTKEATGPVEGASPIQENKGSGVPKEMTEEDIQQYIQDYAQAAHNAVYGAGFDGVEIHGANGYLVDQFTQLNSNTRSDSWGGSVENRSRFALEVSRAVADAVGADRTAIRLSPYGTYQGMRMDDPVPQFTYLIQELKKLQLSYLHITEPRIAGINDADTDASILPFIDLWGGTSPVVVAGGYKADSAKATAEGQYVHADVLFAFGRYFIANPDLVYRVKHGIELSPYNHHTFYTVQDPVGYVDYPFSDAWKREHKL